MLRSLFPQRSAQEFVVALPLPLLAGSAGSHSTAAPLTHSRHHLAHSSSSSSSQPSVGGGGRGEQAAGEEEAATVSSLFLSMFPLLGKEGGLKQQHHQHHHRQPHQQPPQSPPPKDGPTTPTPTQTVLWQVTGEDRQQLELRLLGGSSSSSSSSGSLLEDSTVVPGPPTVTLRLTFPAAILPRPRLFQMEGSSAYGDGDVKGYGKSDGKSDGGCALQLLVGLVNGLVYALDFGVDAFRDQVFHVRTWVTGKPCARTSFGYRLPLIVHFPQPNLAVFGCTNGSVVAAELFATRNTVYHFASGGLRHHAEGRSFACSSPSFIALRFRPLTPPSPFPVHSLPCSNRPRGLGSRIRKRIGHGLR